MATRGAVPDGHIRRRQTEELFQLRRNRGKGCIEFCADALDRRNNDDRDAGGDQAIFNGGRARLVCEELHKGSNHCASIGPNL